MFAPTARSTGQPVVRARAFAPRIIAILALCLVAAMPVRAAHEVELPLPDLVDQALAIEIAVLVAATPRWNQRGNLIVTDYRFRRQRDLLGAGAPGDEFVLSQAGGIIGTVGQALSGNPELVTGTRYLLFVRPGHGEMFAPFVGGEQGVFAFASDGTARSLAGGESLHHDELLELVALEVARRAGAAPVAAPDSAQPPGTYPAKAFVPAGIARPGPAAVPTGPGQAPQAVPTPDGPGQPVDLVAVAEPDRGTDASPPWSTPRYHYGPTVSFPVVYDEFPAAWTWSPHDQYQLATWNTHVNGNLFLISGTQQGTWAWGNNRYELVGFPSNADMIAQFGEGWPANRLAVAYSTWNTSTNVMIEIDIAFNPAFCWTLDAFEASTPSSTCWSFQQTMLHEVGHGWGLDHPWEHQDVWWDSVMNYAPKAYRQTRLNTDDVNAVRARYGGPAQAQTLISQWRTSDATGSNQPTYTAALGFSRSVNHGQTLNFDGPMQIENLGTTAFVNPAVEIYLTHGWNSWSSPYVYLRTANYTSTIGTFATFTYNLGTTTIPATVPTGRYWVTLFLDNGPGSVAYNTSSSNPDVQVTVRNNAPTLAPIEGWRTAALGRIGPSGTWEFLLPAVAGRSYELTTCSGNGGSATFDTVIELVGLGALNDDFCGLQSRLLWAAPSTGTRTVRVRGYNAAATSQGTFVLAYREIISDRIFGNGFQP
jgi:hypothetical protein